MTDPIDPRYVRMMNNIARTVDTALNGRRKPGRKPKLGFVLLVSEFGKIDNGRVNYISNGERADMIAMLKEYLGRLEGRTHSTPERPQ